MIVSQWTALPCVYICSQIDYVYRCMYYVWVCVRTHVLYLCSCLYVCRCAFLFFCSEKRPQLKAQNPGASVGLLAKQLAGAWKLMAADQKRPYEIMADRDKERYDQQKAAYQAGYQASQMQQEMSGSQSSFNFSPTTSNALTMPVVPGISSLPQISQQVTIPANGGATSSSPLLSVASSSRTRKKKDPNMPKRSMLVTEIHTHHCHNTFTPTYIRTYLV